MSDLISRQDAIDALTESNLKRHMDSVEGGQENRSAIRIIMGLPSAERKRGEWKVIDASEPRRYGCSNCKILSWDMTNYCSNCGAKMERREDGE